MPKPNNDKIFVLRYKDSHEIVKRVNGHPVYVSDYGSPTVSLENAALFESSIEAYRRAAYYELDKDVIAKEI